MSIQLPIKPWQAAVINTLIVSLITVLSMVGAGDINDFQIWKAAIFSGMLTFLVQFKELLPDNEEGISYSPLLLVKEKLQ